MTLKSSLATGLFAITALPSLAHADAAVSDLFARATPPNAKNGAAYVTISSSDGDRLLAALGEQRESRRQALKALLVWAALVVVALAPTMLFYRWAGEGFTPTTYSAVDDGGAVRAGLKQSRWHW